MSNPRESDRASHERLVALIGIGLLVATLANGAATYLRRVGLLEERAYEHYLSEHCAQIKHAPTGRCCVPRNPELGLATIEEIRGTRAATAYLYESVGGPLLLKLAKDALVLAFIALSLYFVAQGRSPTLSAWASPPLILLTITVALGFFTTQWQRGDVAAIAGLRPFLFLAVAMVASWSVPGMPLIAKWAGGALACQLLLLPYEWLQGMPLRFCPESLRVAASLVLPNSLGVFAVTTSAFCLAFLRGRVVRAALLLVALLLIFASGSATGLAALLVATCLLALQNVTGWARARVAAISLASLPLLALALPALTRRIDLYDSVFGTNSRLDTLIDTFRTSNALEILVGHGLGHGANVLANLGFQTTRPLDSAVTALFAQLGLLGVVAFYAVLAWGFRQHVALRPFFAAVAVCSITLNVLELFPLNYLLGLALAACLAPVAARRAP